MSEQFVSVTANPLTFSDERGDLKIFHEDKGVVLKRSTSKKGVFRGLHLQLEGKSQTKIIRVVSGKILDFVTDPVANPGILYAKEISPVDDWISIASNYAHGFYAMEDTVFEYLCIGEYDESSEKSLSIENFLKSELGLSDVLLSGKDKCAENYEVTQYFKL